MIVELALAAAGVALQIWFITAEYAGKMARATLLKGLASLMFVALGVYCYLRNPTEFGLLIVIGLALGMAGDIFLNLRNLYEGKTSTRVFAAGILAFLAGHIVYIAALLGRADDIALIALVMTAVVSCVSIPLLMRSVTAPSTGMKIFGCVYLVIVIGMFSCATALIIRQGFTPLNTLFAAGALLFLVSDFILIYYTFGKKLKPLRAVNLMCYYAGQLMIALCVSLA